MNVNDKIYRERVYEIVRKIPVGKVMTYGQLAIVLGEGYTARTVGYVMHASDEGVPWQRVINSQGTPLGQVPDRSFNASGSKFPMNDYPAK